MRPLRYGAAPVGQSARRRRRSGLRGSSGGHKGRRAGFGVRSVLDGEAQFEMPGLARRRKAGNVGRRKVPARAADSTPSARRWLTIHGNAGFDGALLANSGNRRLPTKGIVLQYYANQFLKPDAWDLAATTTACIVAGLVISNGRSSWQGCRGLLSPDDRRCVPQAGALWCSMQRARRPGPTRAKRRAPPTTMFFGENMFLRAIRPAAASADANNLGENCGALAC
jgi:hypothetical protein